MLGNDPFCPSEGSFGIDEITCSNNFIKCEMDENKLQGYVYQCPENYIFSNNSCKSVETVRDCDSDNVTELNLDVPVETENISS